MDYNVNNFTFSHHAMEFKLLPTNPIQRFAIFLILFSAFALGYNFSNDVLLHLAATLGWGLVLYAVYSRFTIKRKNVWDTVITSLIIFLLLHYGTDLNDLAHPLLAVFLAITLKFFVEYKSSPIVNPAAAGLLLSAGILAFFPVEQPFISWWGASFWTLPWGIPLSLVLMAVWVLGGFYVWRKWPLFFAFLISYGVLYFLQTGDGEALRFILMNSTLYFFATIMLSEPKTSPVLPWKQAVYGTLAGVLFVCLGTWNVPYYELFALVGANLLNAGMKWKIT